MDWDDMFQKVKEHLERIFVTVFSPLLVADILWMMLVGKPT
jgi:hypothetical protein